MGVTIREVKPGQKKPIEWHQWTGEVARVKFVDKTLFIYFGQGEEARIRNRSSLYLYFLLRPGDKIVITGRLTKYGLQGFELGYSDPEPTDMNAREAEANEKCSEFEFNNPEYF